jgi:chromosome segregation ATPase
MEIAIVIAGGLVLITLVAGFFDYLGKKKKKSDLALENKVTELERKMGNLEDRLHEKDERLNQLENEISFVNRLIEDKSKK